MKFVTHNHTFINRDGTSLQGKIAAPYAKLVAVFGLPDVGDEYKTDAEWVIKFEDGTIATIYNWKNGKNYLGDEGEEVTSMDRWHVGGISQDAVANVVNELTLADFSDSETEKSMQEEFLEDVEIFKKEEIQGYIMLIVTKEGVHRRVNVKGSDVLHLAEPLKDLSDEFQNDFKRVFSKLAQRLIGETADATQPGEIVKH